MTTFREGELELIFGDAWRAEHFDRPGVGWPKGIAPVDFIAEGRDEIVLLEVKDPSASGATSDQRQRFVRDMQARVLTHGENEPDELAPAEAFRFGSPRRPPV